MATTTPIKSAHKAPVHLRPILVDKWSPNVVTFAPFQAHLCICIRLQAWDAKIYLGHNAISKARRAKAFRGRIPASREPARTPAVDCPSPADFGRRSSARNPEHPPDDSQIEPRTLRYIKMKSSNDSEEHRSYGSGSPAKDCNHQVGNIRRKFIAPPPFHSTKASLCCLSE
uniref:Uncharacterized protein n=1 Tax=Branchiostoma floridae TaxID=7739 RepID=C3Y188_BRAFL|eukprot:XP_002609618.1 hypothetical protein BRAFLDRAFT_87839 [Branchiostoma floridae]